MSRRRLVLFDYDDVSSLVNLYNVGLNDQVCELISLQDLENLSSEEAEKAIKLEDGDAVLLIGGKPFNFRKEKYHFGIRNENYSDCAKLRRLAIAGGAFATCSKGVPFKNQVDYFLSDDITVHRQFDWNFADNIIHTLEDAKVFIKTLDSFPEDKQFGFDYESSGKALDYQFEISGASICTTDFGGFISFTDIRYNLMFVPNGEELYKDFLHNVLGAFLFKRMRNVWTYNMQYEYQVSKRMLNVDLYDLRDASVVNVLMGNHEKKFSLKWTAQMVEGVDVWDDEFDLISDLVNKMLYVEIDGGAKKNKQYVRRQDDYHNTEEWNILMSKYGSYQSEFERLIADYSWSPYMCIPSNILGYYCNLDSYYTLLLYIEMKNYFKPETWDVFSDNIRLGSFLQSTGINKDEQFRREYEKYCKKQLLWGITYCAEARCALKMQQHSTSMANINSYSPICQQLLSENNFFHGDAVEIAKYLLSTNIDTMDTNEVGINDGQLALKYGNDFAEAFVEKLKESMTEAKFKGKIDESVVRKKKLLSIFAEKLEVLTGIDKKIGKERKYLEIKNSKGKVVSKRFTLGKKHEELEKYLFYQRAYNELMKMSTKQLNDINNIPDTIYIFKRKWDNLVELADYISDNYFKSLSPIENDKICLEFTNLYKYQTVWLAALTESVMQLDGAEKFYLNKNITTVQDGFADFMFEWEKKFKNEQYNFTYPDKIFDLALEFFKEPESDQVKEIWSNFNGYKIQEKFFPSISDDIDYYRSTFNESDINDNFKFMRKLNLNYLLFKKYRKVLFTYIGTYDISKGKNVGMFLGEDKCVIEDPVTHTMIREANPDEPGAVTKMTAKFQVMEKSSKRWSSGYHTIISHSDIKDVVRAYPGQILTYFDISSAEVKSAGYQSGDPELIRMFNNGIDVYVATAKLYYKDKWDTMSDKDKKVARKAFKQIFLGIMYGMGKNLLASKLNCSPAEADLLIKTVYDAYPKLREYIARQQVFPLNNNGYINTFFGDWLQVAEWFDYVKASMTNNVREMKNAEAKINRLGVNLPIQGGTSEAMTSGFWNDIRVSKREGWPITSFITVHDSNTGSIPCHKLWGIKKYYDKNFTEHCKNYTGIMLLFDLMVGSGYESACEFKQISDDVIELSGNAHSIQMIIDRMNEDPELRFTTNIPREEIVPNYVEDAMVRFIKEGGCSMVKDESKYKVQFTKLN